MTRSGDGPGWIGRRLALELADEEFGHVGRAIDVERLDSLIEDPEVFFQYVQGDLSAARASPTSATRHARLEALIDELTLDVIGVGHEGSENDVEVDPLFRFGIGSQQGCNLGGERQCQSLLSGRFALGGRSGFVLAHPDRLASPRLRLAGWGRHQRLARSGYL